MHDRLLHAWAARGEGETEDNRNGVTRPSRVLPQEPARKSYPWDEEGELPLTSEGRKRNHQKGTREGSSVGTLRAQGKRGCGRGEELERRRSTGLIAEPAPRPPSLAPTSQKCWGPPTRDHKGRTRHQTEEQVGPLTCSNKRKHSGGKFLERSAAARGFKRV